MHITELLQRVGAGDRQALDVVIPLVDGELKKLAAGHLRREGRERTLDTTALVHEAFRVWCADVIPPTKTVRISTGSPRG